MLAARPATILALCLSTFTMALPPCRKNTGSPITRIAYSTTGGRAGNYEALEINPDSTFFTKALRGNEQYVKQKTDRAFWNDIIQTIRLADFDRVRSDGGHALYDGIDVTITIEKGAEKHSIVNGETDSLAFRRIAPFTRKLNEKLEELRKKF